MIPAAIQKDIDTVRRLSAVPSILKVVSELTGMRLSLVARVTKESWTACAVNDQMNFGLAVGGELDVATTLCKEVCESGQSVIIEQASTDSRYANHHTPKLYKIESYIAIPIMAADGGVFGTLCALDSKAVKLDAKVIESLHLFTELIASQLRAEEEHRSTRETLGHERQMSELREQFIAVLGHDIRTPLGAIAASTSALQESQPTPDQQEMLQGIDESCQQMARLIEQTLDFARGRLGGGITLERKPLADIRPIIDQAVREVRRAHPARPIQLTMTDALPATVDEVKLHQLISNLVGNAVQHSPAGAAVEVQAERQNNFIQFRVKNAGKALPNEMVGRTFSPFVRRVDGKKNAGLGLGLYIASEIAKGHGGGIEAASAEGSTTFTVILPAAE